MTGTPMTGPLLNARYRARDLKRVAGITHRQAQYWDSTGLLQAEATLNAVRKSRTYSLLDLAVGHVISSLNEGGGISIQQLRPIAPQVRGLITEHGRDLFQLKILFVPPSDFILGGDDMSFTNARGKIVCIEVGKALRSHLLEVKKANGDQQPENPS